MLRSFINRMVGKPRRRGIIRVWCKWDSEAGVWYVVKSELPGIAAEAETLEELGKTVMLMAEDLMDHTNGGGVGSSHREVPVELLSRFSSHAYC